MRVSFDTAAARDALGVMIKHYGRRTPAVLAGAFLELDASGTTLALRRDDTMTAGVTAVFSAVVDTPGVVTLDAAAFAGALPKGTGRTTATLDGDRLTLDSCGTVSTIRVLANEKSVPVAYAGARNTAVVLSSAELDRVARVLDAAARGADARAVLESVAFVANGNGTGEAVATDTYRLHRARLGRVAGEPRETLLVPELLLRVAVNTAGRGLSDSVRIDAGGGYVTLAYTGTKGPRKAPRVVHYYVTGRAVEGPFPNYGAIIPSEDDASTSWTITDAAGTAAALASMANRKNAPAMLDASGAAVSASMSLDGATTATVLPIEADGVPFAIAFNPEYAADAVKAAGDGATVLLRDGLKAALFRGEDVDALLMPMRVS